MIASGQVVLVDDEDFLAVLSYVWHVNKDGYPYAHIPGSGRGGSKTALHKLIAGRMGLIGEIDHEGGNKLDCRRSKLRACTHSQNLANRSVTPRNLLGVKGVFRRPSGRYRASIRVRGLQINIGTYDTVEEASDAYYEAAKHYFGEFASR